MKHILAQFVDPKGVSRLPVLYFLIAAQTKSKDFYTKKERTIFIKKYNALSLADGFYKPISKFPKNDSETI